MGLKAANFNAKDLNGKTIVDMKVDLKNESTVTYTDHLGNKVRMRIPAGVVHLMDFYASNTEYV